MNNFMLNGMLILCHTCHVSSETADLSSNVTLTFQNTNNFILLQIIPYRYTITENVELIRQFQKNVVITTNMASKLPKTTLDLKQFLLRQEVLKLYRDIFKTLRKISDENTRLELKDWARSDFRNNKHHTDVSAIKSMLYYGRKSLKDLEMSLALSES